jgi:hypothetical protein
LSIREPFSDQVETRQSHNTIAQRALPINEDATGCHETLTKHHFSGVSFIGP